MRARSREDRGRHEAVKHAQVTVAAKVSTHAFVLRDASLEGRWAPYDDRRRRLKTRVDAGRRAGKLSQARVGVYGFPGSGGAQ